MSASTPRVKTGYHHGNLRQDLVAAALEIINRRGPEGLTLREVAKRLGVTAAAPYRHFESKEALLAAVATDGFTTLLEGMQVALEEAGPEPLARYEAMAVGYVRFATAHPDHFRVMYGPEVDFEDVAVPQRRAAFKLLQDSVVACQDAGLAISDYAGAIANKAWAYAHGLVTLYLHGLLPRSIDIPALIELARHIRVFLRDSEPPTRAATAANPGSRRVKRPGAAGRARR